MSKEDKEIEAKYHVERGKTVKDYDKNRKWRTMDLQKLKQMIKNQVAKEFMFLEERKAVQIFVA
jgi:hypothetical protein